MSALDRLIPPTTSRTRGWITVAWALRVVPRGERDSRLELALRLHATDDDAWRETERYNTVAASHLAGAL